MCSVTCYRQINQWHTKKRHWLWLQAYLQLFLPKGSSGWCWTAHSLRTAVRVKNSHYRHTGVSDITPHDRTCIGWHPTWVALLDRVFVKAFRKHHCDTSQECMRRVSWLSCLDSTKSRRAAPLKSADKVIEDKFFKKCIETWILELVACWIG